MQITAKLYQSSLVPKLRRLCRPFCLGFFTLFEYYFPCYLICEREFRSSEYLFGIIISVRPFLLKKNIFSKS